MAEKRKYLAIAILGLLLGGLLGIALDRKLVRTRSSMNSRTLSGVLEGSAAISGDNTTGYLHNGLAQPIVVLSFSGEDGACADIVGVGVPYGVNVTKGISLPLGAGQYAIILPGTTCYYVLPGLSDQVTVSYYCPFEESVSAIWPDIQQLMITTIEADE